MKPDTAPFVSGESTSVPLEKAHILLFPLAPKTLKCVLGSIRLILIERVTFVCVRRQYGFDDAGLGGIM